MPIEMVFVPESTPFPTFKIEEAKLHTITCAVITADRFVLAFLRKDGGCELLGGSVDPEDGGEIIAAMKREFKEETGIEPSESVFTYRAYSRWGKNREKTTWIFTCLLPKSHDQYSIKLDPDEHVTYLWIQLDHVPPEIFKNEKNKHQEFFDALHTKLLLS